MVPSSSQYQNVRTKNDRKRSESGSNRAVIQFATILVSDVMPHEYNRLHVRFSQVVWSVPSRFPRMRQCVLCLGRQTSVSLNGDSRKV